MRKLRLAALIYSVDEYLTVRGWRKESGAQIDVRIDAGIATGALVNEVDRILILQGQLIDGILVGDHRRFSDNQIEKAIKQLQRHDKWLY